jgi:hypothetical protein
MYILDRVLLYCYLDSGYPEKVRGECGYIFAESKDVKITFYALI